MSAPAPRVFGRWSRHPADVRAVRDRRGDVWARSGRRWFPQQEDWADLPGYRGVAHGHRGVPWWRLRRLAPLTEEVGEWPYSRVVSAFPRPCRSETERSKEET